MNESALRELLDDVASGRVEADRAVEQLRKLPFADTGDALVDHHRQLRQGMPEVVYGPGKSPEQCVSIVAELLGHDDSAVLVTRVNPEQAAALEGAYPGGVHQGGAMLWRAPTPNDSGVLIMTAGTADAPVADEAAITLDAAGIAHTRLNDVGVAGLHRLLAHLDTITSASAIIVVAGMEGALASVVGGLTAAPIVAVPTSVGYGAGLDGVTALLAMLSSCASGLSVVGIDNGFGAAVAVTRMVKAGVR